MRADLTVDVRVLRNQQNNSNVKTIQLKTCHTRTTSCCSPFRSFTFSFHFCTFLHSTTSCQVYSYQIPRYKHIFASIYINTLYKVATIFLWFEVISKSTRRPCLCLIEKSTDSILSNVRIRKARIQMPFRPEFFRIEKFRLSWPVLHSANTYDFHIFIYI